MLGFMHAWIMRDSEEDCVWEMDGEKGCWICRVAQSLQSRLPIQYIRWNKRACENNQKRLAAARREGGNEEDLLKCSSLLHSLRVFYFSQMLFSSLRESDSSQIATPDSNHPWSTTQTKQHCRILMICVVLLHVNIAQSTFYLTWKRCLDGCRPQYWSVGCCAWHIGVWIPLWP